MNKKRLVLPKTISFDVMLDGRYVNTFNLLVTEDLVTDRIDVIVFNYNKINEMAKALVEKKMPSLKYKDYKIIA